jgi:DNA-binding GntR family transcriptional regulator
MWLQSGPYLTMLLPKMRGIHFHSLAISAARRRDPEDAARAIEQDIVTAAQYLHSMIGALGAASRPRREP